MTVIYLSKAAADRFRSQWTIDPFRKSGSDTPEEPESYITDDAFYTENVTILPSGWVSTYFYLHPDDSTTTRVEVLFAPSEVLAIVKKPLRHSHNATPAREEAELAAQATANANWAAMAANNTTP